jgi:hypothetical protein
MLLFGMPLQVWFLWPALGMVISGLTEWVPSSQSRVWQGYGSTCGDQVMGITGTGMVVDFDTLQHTAYPYHSITGIHR